LWNLRCRVIKFCALVPKRRKNIAVAKNIGFNKIAWKFRGGVPKCRKNIGVAKNIGFDKIAWKFRWRVTKRRKISVSTK
jgi:hypothetical protein